MKKIVWHVTFLLAALHMQAQFTKLFDFSEIPAGKRAYGSLISDGTFLYGVSSLGGINGDGTLFKIMPDGTGFVKLLDFDASSTGSEPLGTLYFNGTYLFGVAQKGGTLNHGTIFRIKPDGTGFMILKNFDDFQAGRRPKFEALVSSGTFLYGTTWSGGHHSQGTVFKILPDGSNFETVMYASTPATGKFLAGGLLLDGNTLYGTTEAGGTNDLGTIFRINTDSTNYATLVDFAGATNGAVPYSTLISVGDYLYGTASAGGATNDGVIFRLKRDGTNYSVLHHFDGANNGGSPDAGLTFLNNRLYSLTSNDGPLGDGILYRIDTNGNNFTKLHDFTTTDGNLPYGAMYTDGFALYGLTSNSGGIAGGTIYKFVDNTIGLVETKQELEVACYPNPTKGMVELELNATDFEQIEITIQSILGAIIYTQYMTDSRVQIDLSAQPRGVYLLHVRKNRALVSKKIVLY